jgi:spore coat protein A, manganese oxidase
MISRRRFMKMSAMAGAGVALSNSLFSRKAFAFSQSPPNIRKFHIAIPGLGPTGANELGNYIPVLSPDTTTYPGVDAYKIVMGEFTQQVHPDLPGPTKFWGYADATTRDHKYLGGLIVAQKDRPVRLLAKNELPNKHPLPVDTTIMGAELAQNRATVHFHGGFVPWTSDGGPFSWFTPRSKGPNQGAGPSFQNPGPTPGTAEYYYPNQQSARLGWYHDHALGITRLNAYAGMATGYLITDTLEQTLVNAGVIPSRQVPLVLQDKTFVDGSDPGYIWGEPGELWYPYLYETSRWERGGNNIKDLPPVSCVPEFFADTSLVNGAPYPYLPVEQTRYRFRILNGSQARFYNLQLYYADSSGTEADLRKPGPAFIQIGTEGGFLPRPVLLNAPPVPTPLVAPDTANPDGPFNLMIGPGERADIIIDFSNVPTGAKLILYTDAPGPFPGGDPLNDYTTPGVGPNTRTLLQFRVIPRSGPKDQLNFQQTFAALRLGLLPLAQERMRPTNATPVRDLTLNEDFDDYGRLIQRLGTTTPNGLNNTGNLTFAHNYDDFPTEIIRAGTTEVWRIFNLTGDTHPIHFHLVNCQVLWRAPFDATTPDFRAIGRKSPPDANESGWKETVRMNPGEVTAVIMKFDLPNVPFTVPASLRLRNQYGIRNAAEYVWHCHILEHEEHDMMRPLVVR